MVVLRSLRDAQTLIALLGGRSPGAGRGAHSDDERRRALDLLAGWALGSGGDLDRIGPNTVLARPPGSEKVMLGRTSLASAVEEVFGEGGWSRSVVTRRSSCCARRPKGRSRPPQTSGRLRRVRDPFRPSGTTHIDLGGHRGRRGPTRARTPPHLRLQGSAAGFPRRRDHQAPARRPAKQTAQAQLSPPPAENHPESARP